MKQKRLSNRPTIDAILSGAKLWQAELSELPQGLGYFLSELMHSDQTLDVF